MEPHIIKKNKKLKRNKLKRVLKEDELRPETPQRIQWSWIRVCTEEANVLHVVA